MLNVSLLSFDTKWTKFDRVCILSSNVCFWYFETVLFMFFFLKNEAFYSLKFWFSISFDINWLIFCFSVSLMLFSPYSENDLSDLRVFILSTISSLSEFDDLYSLSMKWSLSLISTFSKAFLWRLVEFLSYDFLSGRFEYRKMFSLSY